MKGGDRMKRRREQAKHKQNGNIMLITTIILLVLTIIVVSCINISGMQFKLSILERNTSNTYYLAESAIEKQVDAVNKSLESEISNLVKEVNDKYIDQISQINSKSKAEKILAAQGSSTIYEDLEYDTSEITNPKIRIKQDKLKLAMQDELYKYVKKHYVGKDLVYTVEGDRTAGNKTTITLKMEELSPLPANPNEFKVTVTAETKNGTTIYDRQELEAKIKIDVPDALDNQIHERYGWAFHASEFVDAPLTCFSDVVITSDTLNVIGDMLVKGDKKGTTYTNAAPGTGIDLTTSPFADPDQNGGVIANTGGKIVVTGNLYCHSNVMVSDGWGGSSRANGSSITVTGDVIANTVGIVDDYYEGGANQSPFGTSGQVSNASISVTNNVMVDNDVMIDRWVNGSPITVGGVIFGTSGGNETQTINGVNVADPNQSSGVFSQGPGSIITATGGIFVAGQPYITLQSGTLPMKLYESVGEPFNGVASWAGYQTNTEDPIENPKYLDAGPFQTYIQKNKVITALANSYAPAKVSASGTTTTCQAVFGAVQTAATAFFYQGGSTKVMSDFGATGDYSGVAELFSDTGIAKFYSGDTEFVDKAWAYNRILGSTNNNYKGLKGYMTAKRNVFYKQVANSGLTTLSFDEALIGLSGLEVKEWTYKDPIQVFDNGGSVDIGNLYVKEGINAEKPWPSIIVNRGSNPLTLTTTGGNVFEGIIISKGKVIINGDITIKGSVIIGGPELSSTNRESIMTGGNSGLSINGNVTIEADPSMLLKVIVKNHKQYRIILDALKITNYAGNTDLNSIMKQHNGNVKYSVGKVFFTKDSYLEIDTEKIKVNIQQIYKKN